MPDLLSGTGECLYQCRRRDLTEFPPFSCPDSEDGSARLQHYGYDALRPFDFAKLHYLGHDCYLADYSTQGNSNLMLACAAQNSKEFTAVAGSKDVMRNDLSSRYLDNPS